MTGGSDEKLDVPSSCVGADRSCVEAVLLERWNGMMAGWMQLGLRETI